MVIAGTKGGQEYADKKDAISGLQTGDTHQATVTAYVGKAPQADDEERQVRRDVPEIADRKYGPAISELVISRILGNRRGKQEAEGDYRE